MSYCVANSLDTVLTNALNLHISVGAVACMQALLLVPTLAHHILSARFATCSLASVCDSMSNSESECT